MTSNTLLTSLPASELERLRPYLRKVNLTLGKQLHAPGERADALYFVQSGAVTCYMFVASGESVEVGVFGAGSVVGFPRVLGDRPVQGASVVTIPGTAVAIGASDFIEQVPPGSPLWQLVAVCAVDYIAVIGQLAACHALHRLEARLARLLLTLADHAEDGAIPVTHDALAEMLGVHRPSVTYALQGLVQAGAVKTERRSLRVRDRDILGERSCECYGTIRRLLGSHGRNGCVAAAT